MTALLVVVLSGCQSADGPDKATPSEKPTSTATPAKPAPRPEVGTCRAMTYKQSSAATDESRRVQCKKDHTAQTFFVDTFASVIDGHLVTVDSDHAQSQISAQCPKHFDDYVGGTEEERRLSMLSVAWFSPTVEQSDAGQDWYRCDITLVSSPEKLGKLTGDLKGVLDTPEGRDRFGMCSTGEPGTPQFKRVVCSSNHSWRAIGTIDVQPAKGDAYPGLKAAQESGGSCEGDARARADDPLSFRWGYEWPTKQQWNAGRHYGFCWAPSS
ncbi:MAG: septum formation family protein [Nocardioides sp.]|nr:septum formation family protein [Nocardioides sp.]